MKYVLLLFALQSCHATLISQNMTPAEPALSELADLPNVRDFSMTASGNEAYFTIQSPLQELSVLSKIEKINNTWGPPVLASFSGKYKDLEPFLSPNGLKLYFASNRPLDNTTEEAKDFDIWFVERQDTHSAWGTPVNLGTPINTASNEFYPSVANNGNMYFTSDQPTSNKGGDDIFVSVLRDGKYDAPQSMSDSINTEGYEFNAYISPDESYLIFSGYNREDGYGSADLYISYQDEQHNWSAATNLGADVNSKSLDYCPYIDLASMTLYFTSKRSTVRETNDFRTIKDVIEEVGKYENGFSRIYKIPMTDVIDTQ